MRKLFLTASAAILACAFANTASAQTGHVEVVYENYDLEFLSDEIDISGLGGQIAFDAGPVGIQLDGRYADWSGAGDVDVWGIGAHVFTRNDQWLFGGYAGYDTIDDADLDVWTGALEAQYYMPRSTLTGVLSHSDADVAGDFNVTMLEGEYRYFFTDNLSLHGGLGIGQGDFGASDIDLWSGEVGGEFQFEAIPISVFGFYRHGNLEAGPADVDTDTYGVGLRYNWGGTLMDRNRSGAGLKRVIPVIERVIT